MATLTHPEFDSATEAITVAQAFAPSIKGRTILITGVNRLGIGYTTAEAFASESPRLLILAGRSPAKVQECIDALSQKYPDVEYRLLQVDLSSQESVRNAASTVLSREDVPTIDLVINNAGVMCLPERTLSPDGIEMHLATNHIGHFLLTNLIMPKLIAAAKDKAPGTVRIINVSSVGTCTSPFRASDPNFTKSNAELPDNEKGALAMLKAAGLPAEEDKTYLPMIAYGHSKTCNILHAVGLDKRLYEKYGIVSVALYPGDMRSELIRHTDQEWLAKAMAAREAQGHRIKTLEEGSSTTLVAALDPKLDKPGNGYFVTNCQVGTQPPAPKYAVDEAEADKLWETSEELVGEKFAW
ncbi:hypothetical protein LTR10_012698 [Elasticomyces elasticus]|nr:hypothetical protein LTR10_012698 [Elasticomyces elasticus]